MNKKVKNLVNNIVQQNTLLRHENFKFDYVFCKKIRNDNFSMTEVYPTTFKVLIEKYMPELYIGWIIYKKPKCVKRKHLKLRH